MKKIPKIERLDENTIQNQIDNLNSVMSDHLSNMKGDYLFMTGIIIGTVLNLFASVLYGLIEDNDFYKTIVGVCSLILILSFWIGYRSSKKEGDKRFEEIEKARDESIEVRKKIRERNKKIEKTNKKYSGMMVDDKIAAQIEELNDIGKSI